jgi:hypothetical protein
MARSRGSKDPNEEAAMPADDQEHERIEHQKKGQEWR